MVSGEGAASGQDFAGSVRVLETALGGRVVRVRRLSGGASRVTFAFDLEHPRGAARPLVLQRTRRAGVRPGEDVEMEATLLRVARTAGVPVPVVVAAGRSAGLPAGWLVVERLEGETIPRRILRDDAFARVRPALNGQVARALAAIHSIDLESVPGLPEADPLGNPLELLDGLRQSRPVLELGVRWQARSRPPPGDPVVLHGDFRMGNLLVGTGGLRGVLDWELAHAGDPAEDIGWLCARAWRFGGPGRVGGFGDLDGFLSAYEHACGRVVDPDRVRWWEAYAAIKWAVICLIQASAHLSGATRSVELAAIGRRVCESEWDLLVLMEVVTGGRGHLGHVTGTPDRTARRSDATDTANGPLLQRGHGPLPGPDPLFGRPSLTELVDAVGEYLETEVMAAAEGAEHFEARVARNILAIVARQLHLGMDAAASHAQRLEKLEVEDDAALGTAIRAGRYDKDLQGLGMVLAPGVLDQLLVANPRYLEGPS